MIRRLLEIRLFVWAAIAATLIAGHGLVARGQGQGQGQQAPELPPPINESDDPLLKPFVWRAIGPANMGGRIDDIAVDEKNPSTFYLGFASGGLWKTTNNGTTFTPIFDEYTISSIGDIALAPSDPETIYVGTGEPNNRQSSTLGGGMFRSTDGGEKFEYIGLKETQSIARVVVHPTDRNIVYVAAVGHLFGPNKERGLYKTTDGGKTWTNTKFIDEHTGFSEVVMHPTKPNTLFAASISAEAPAVGLQWRRTGQRDLEDDRRCKDLDQDHGQGAARPPDHRPHRHRHLALEPGQDHGLDRSRSERRHGRRRE